MKIAFFGDSLTEGFSGMAYFSLLQQRFPKFELFNYGKGGDTVISLLKRIESTAVPSKLNLAAGTFAEVIEEKKKTPLPSG